MSWYVKVLKNYAVFTGRAQRMEYWMFTLFNVLAVIVLLAIGAALSDPENGAGFSIAVIYYVGTIIPTVALTVRRLHDIGRSGWWMLIAFVPLASIVLVIFMCMDSQQGSNDYGPNPKGDTPVSILPAT